MAQVLEQGDIFGRIGKQLGEGFAEQIPRNQLSKQLEGINGLHPGIAKAARIPGGLEAIRPYAEYFNSQAQADAIPDIEPSSTLSTSNDQSSIIPNTQDRTSKIPIPPQRLSSDPNIIMSRAKAIYKKNPARFKGNFDNAVSYETGLVTTQENQIRDVEKKFDELLPTLLHKEGKTTTSDVLGKLQNNFKKEAADSVISGKNTIDQAAREYTRKAHEFAQARDKMTSQGRSFWSSLFSKKPQKEVLAARKAYVDAGVPDAFVDELVANRKFSLPFASRIGFPPSGKVKEELNSITSAGFSNVADARLGKGKVDEKVFQKVLSKLTPNDSVQSIAYELRKKGYSLDAFLNAADNAKNLSAFQKKELQERPLSSTTLSDILYEEMASVE